MIQKNKSIGTLRILRRNIIPFVIFISFISVASAADMTYYWIPFTGTIGSSGFTANWGSCNSQPTSYRITELSNTGFTCSSDRLTTTSSGDQFLAISPTAYSSDTVITGKTGATFYLSGQGYSGTYRFDIGYAKNGTFTSLGYVTQAISSSSALYTVNMSSIKGTAPSGSYLALKVSVTTYRGGRVYLGTNGGSTGSNSGRFYINESPAQPPIPTYNVTITASPMGANVTAGNSYIYNITINNTGNTNGNYTISTTDSDTLNFANSIIGSNNLQINSGGSSSTTLNVTAKSGATNGSIDNTTITVISIENSTYTNSTQVRTTVIPPPPPPPNYKIIVNTDRYSLFAPWTNKVNGASLSANFSAYALLLDDSGKPLSGQTITFKIYSGGGTLKITQNAITQHNGIATVPYDTINDFTSRTDPDYGIWRIDAYLTNTPTVIGNTNMRIEVGGDAISGCGLYYCHEIRTASGAKPHSPYTDGYGSTSTRAVAAHEKSDHIGKGCYYCHTGYATNKTGLGYTGDVHKNRSCDFCHGNWSYITSQSGGNGIPKMPSCYDCHPIFNSNPSSIRTLANLLGGNNISVFSFNFDQKKPLVAHTNISFSLVDGVPCLACHGPAHNTSKPYMIGSTNNITENEQCWSCHTNRATTHKLSTNCVSCHTQNAHNISIAGGGPDCISCHSINGGSANHKVDTNAMAQGVHANINSGAVANGVSADNKKCWGCHQTGGIQPTDMGDRYKNPYKCYECHNATKPYTNVNNAPTVSQHFKDGTNIIAASSADNDSASCITCHNLTEMKVSYTPNLDTQYSLPSHYGKNRSDLRIGGSTDCKYCHQNTSTVFTNAMNNTNNDNMLNHSTLTTTPVCTTCHGSGEIHDSSLNKPNTSDDAYCNTCHGPGGSASTNNKVEHKTLNCTECHANNTPGNLAGRDIHGIKYIQKDNTFSTNKTNAVDCTTCHQNSIVDSSIGMIPIKISNPLHHSDDINNGSKWGDYWNSSINSCIYCHNDTKHSLTPLGRPLIWNTSYVLNSLIDSGTNCADCHYKGSSNYANMQNTYISAGLNIPPEITNGSWNGKTGYYNHSLSDYSDAQCKSCHDRNGSTTVGQFMHNVSIGAAGGPDCKSCHDITGSAPKLVNFSVADNAAHKNLNNNAASAVDPDNKKCWACHGDGTQPSGHPANYKTPASCENCHIAGNYSAPLVYNHIQNATNVHVDNATCSTCHDNGGMYIDAGGIGTITHYLNKVTDTNITPYGHFGTIDTTNCIICHNGPYTGNASWGSPVNITTSLKRIHTETTNSQCDQCHKDNNISTLANVDFHNASFTNFGGNCLDCHISAE